MNQHSYQLPKLNQQTYSSNNISSWWYFIINLCKKYRFYLLLLYISRDNGLKYFLKNRFGRNPTL
jgi:hypothetical protein